MSHFIKKGLCPKNLMDDAKRGIENESLNA